MKQNYILYAGSYAAAEEAGIHGYRLIRGEGGEPRLTEVFAAAGVSNPSYLAVSSDGRFLYSVMEDMTYEGRTGGGVAAFRIHGDSLTLLNTRGTEGTLPCHLLPDEKRGFLYAANYMSGSVSMFRLNADGSIGELCDLKQHSGHGPNEERQEGPHVHYAGYSADEAGLWCVDLGIDRIKYYRIDEKNGKLEPDENRDIVFPGGTGPRHFVLNREKRELMYVVSELSSEVFVIQCSGGENRILQRVSTLPEQAEQHVCGHSFIRRRAFSLRFQPRARQHRGVCGGRRYRTSHVHRADRDEGEDAQGFLPLRGRNPFRESGQRYDYHVSI